MDEYTDSLSSKVKNPLRRRKQLEQDLEHVTQEMYRRNLELAETNKTLSLLRKIDSLVLESREGLNVLSGQLCDVIASTNGYPLAAILTHHEHQSNHLVLSGMASPILTKNPDMELLGKIKVDMKLNWLRNDIKSCDIDLSHHSDDKVGKALGLTEIEFHQLFFLVPVKSVHITKLLTRGHLVGLMVVGFHAIPMPILDKNRVMLDRLSESVGVAIDNKLLYEENQRVLDRLQQNNEKLKELDETKDEFISMASHQLRTPLTSAKGYLSMVLEGDAGKLNDMQRELLEQSFASSQRMVYLIADLLNVSRLKTGKFIIDSKPTKLSDVVKAELGQLNQAAKTKKIKLEYSCPADFPVLMLDETKIRQVIMNFVDNALYYTPAKGRITVELTEDKSNVYFMVKDSGLGVPKHEQSHLFTKFYRASNAKKSRPDGTGLGLYMAKKVIAAQGGHIIFESVENQGSTFGFTFQKSKLITQSSKNH